jgi:hypothetical protein
MIDFVRKQIEDFKIEDRNKRELEDRFKREKY